MTACFDEGNVWAVRYSGWLYNRVVCDAIRWDAREHTVSLVACTVFMRSSELLYVCFCFQRDVSVKEKNTRIEEIEKELAEYKQASQNTEYEKEQQITALKADAEQVWLTTCYV